MTPLGALLELLERLEASRGATALLSDGELSRWPVEAVRSLKSQKLLITASPAVTVVCPGCEQECTMAVHTLPAGTRPAGSFIVCDKRGDINRVAVPVERLRQWRCSAETAGAFVAQCLGLRADNQRKAGDGLWELGLMTGNKRSQMVCLRAAGALELVAGQNAFPLAELVRYGTEGYSVNLGAIRQLVDAATTGDPRYTPSNARREARKLVTQDLYKRWQKEYKELRLRRPQMSDKWYSQQIAKMDILPKRNSETIRRHMKNRK